MTRKLKPVHPGEILREEFMKPLGLSMNRLALELRVPVTRVADIVNERRAMRVRVYAYDAIETALDDLSGGGCDAFMKLAPVTAWFVRDRPRLKVVETGITQERLGICVRRGDTALAAAIGEAQSALMADGTIPSLIKQWLGSGAALPP